MSEEIDNKLLTVVMSREEYNRNDGYIPKTLLTPERRLRLKTPDGNTHEVENGWIMNPSYLQSLTAEYVALEVLTACNADCRGFCYVAPRRIRKSNGTEENGWMNEEFIEELAKIMGYNIFPGRVREICISGGEPTLNLEKLHSTFKTLMSHTNPPQPKESDQERFIYRLPGKGVFQYGQTRIVVASNLILFELDEEILNNQVGPFNGGTIQGSYNKPLKQRYNNGWIPTESDPIDTLNRKIQFMNGFLWENYRSGTTLEGIDFFVRITGSKRNGDELTRLEKEFALIHGDSPRGKFWYTAEIAPVGDAIQSPKARQLVHKRCKDGEEVYIAFNGQIFPNLEETVLGSIGRIGFLL